MKTDISKTVLKHLNDMQIIKNDLHIQAGFLTSEITGLDLDIFVKRIKSRNIFQKNFFKIFGTNARRTFKIHKKFSASGLSVSEPLDFHETSDEVILMSVYYRNSSDFGNSYKTQLKDAARAGLNTAKVIAEFHSAGAVHNDLKWSNILVTSDGAYKLIDLEHAEFHKKPCIKGISADLTRFYRFGLEMNAENWVKSHFSESYLENLNEKLRHEINFDVISRKAFSEWIKKGRRIL